MRPTKRVGLVPSDLPEKIGEPVNKAIQFGPMTMNMTQCGDAYGQFSTGSTNSAGMMGGSGENFFGCVYLSKDGIRMAVVLEQFTQSSSGLFGAMIAGVRDAIRGDDQAFGKEVFDKMIAAVRTKVPGVMVELVELPGGKISRPDGEKVAQLLKRTTIKHGVDALAGMDKSQPVAPNASTTAEIVTAPLAPAATATIAPVKNTSNIAQTIEARKQLTAMGLSYFSLDQFHEAISRKDALAVRLFVDANAVKARAPNSKGQTGAELAKQSGDDEIIALVSAVGN
jgi:hypothetical protein